MTFEQYFDDSQHRFMTAVTETLIACRWEDDEAYAVAPDVLTDWEYADYEVVKEFKHDAKAISKSMSDVENAILSTNNIYFYVNVFISGIWYEIVKPFTSESEAKQRISELA